MPSQPLYMDIYHDLLELIHHNGSDKQFTLPTERELCLQYRVSRSTIRSALAMLKDDGYIYTIHGSGTFVKSPVIEQKLQNLYSFTDELKCRSDASNCEIVEYSLIPADAELSKKIHCPIGDRLHRFMQLRSVIDSPLMLETTYLPQSRFYRINPEIVKNASLYVFLRSSYSLRIDHAVETFQPLLPSPKEKELLHIHHALPCMLLERYAYEDGHIIEYTRSVVRGDKCVFRVDLDGYT